MPEAHLFAAPPHFAPTANSPSPLESSLLLLSNGNRPQSTQLTSLTGTGSVGNVVAEPATQAVSAPAALGRFYGRRPHLCSAMGQGESKHSENKIIALFEQYKDSNDDCILAEGIEQFCKDLQIPPEDFKILVLAWKLNAEQMCCFTRNEFITGLKSIRCDSIKSIQTRLPELVAEVDWNREQFKDLYRFTFRFGLDTANGQRILPTDMAVVLWQLIFSRNEPPVLKRWLGFLETHQSIRGIPRDTWNMFLNFSETVGNDLSSYDDTEAWPSLFDDFVEYENDQANQNITKDKEQCEITKDD